MMVFVNAAILWSQEFIFSNKPLILTIFICLSKMNLKLVTKTKTLPTARAFTCILKVINTSYKTHRYYSIVNLEICSGDTVIAYLSLSN